MNKVVNRLVMIYVARMLPPCLSEQWGMFEMS